MEKTSADILKDHITTLEQQVISMAKSQAVFNESIVKNSQIAQEHSSFLLQQCKDFHTYFRTINEAIIDLQKRVEALEINKNQQS